MILLIQMNYQPNYSTLKTVAFDAFWNIYSDDLLDIVTTQTKIYAKQHKGIIWPAAS